MWSKVFLLLIVFCVTHAHPPGFDTKVEEVLLVQGSTASVWCNASGDEPMNYKWYTDDENEILSNSSDSLYSNVTSKGAFLIFNPVKASHNRSYTCIATNVHGLRVKVFSIVVRENKGRPDFYSLYERVAIREGEYNLIKCSARSSKPIHYDWYSPNGTMLEKQNQWNNSRVYLKTSSVGVDLVFDRTEMNDTGEYNCTASNEYGNMTKRFFIDVQKADKKKPEFDNIFESVAIRETQIQIIMCSAKGPKPIQYKWYYSFDGKELENQTRWNSSRVYVRTWSDRTELVFDRAQMDDVGNYTCVASNIYGNTTKTFFVDVEKRNSGKPILGKFGWSVMEAGVKYKVWCNASGAEPIQFQWYNSLLKEIPMRNGTSVNRVYSEYVQNSSSESFLVFDPPEVNDTGIYYCQGINNFGNATKRFDITVQPRIDGGKPAVLDKFISRPILRAGVQNRVWCNASGDEPIQFKWYNSVLKEIPMRNGTSSDRVYTQNSQSILGGSHLVFNPSEVNDTGTYYCQAFNNFGNDTKQFDILVQPKRDDGNITGNKTDFKIRIVEVTDTSVKFSVNKYNSSDLLNVLYRESAENVLKNQSVFLANGVNGTMFEIRELIPSGRYSFWFTTNSSISWSMINETHLEVVLLPSQPELSFRSMKDNSVELEWIRFSDDLYRKTIDKYYISYNTIQMVGGNDWSSSNCTIKTEIPACINSSYTISGLSQKIHYEIRVQAHTEAGYGDPNIFKILLS